MPKSPSLTFPVEPKKFRRVEAGNARFDESDLDGSPSELASKLSPYSDRQAAKLLPLDKSAPAADSAESNTRKEALQAKLPWPAEKYQLIFPRRPLGCRPLQSFKLLQDAISFRYYEIHWSYRMVEKLCCGDCI
jgi:hypothetical protein